MTADKKPEIKKKATSSGNKMREIKVAKVTINMGIGADQDKIEVAAKLLENIAGKKPVKTLSKKRIATWKIRPGLPLGWKVTVRNKQALQLLLRLLKAIDFKIKKSSFNTNGFSFGIKEYIDIPNAKYDPKVGIIGMDVCVTLERPGFRIARRKLLQKKIPAKHIINKDDARKFAEEKLGVIVE